MPYVSGNKVQYVTPEENRLMALHTQDPVKRTVFEVMYELQNDRTPGTQWPHYFELCRKWITSNQDRFVRWPIHGAELPNALATGLANYLTWVSKMFQEPENTEDHEWAAENIGKLKQRLTIQHLAMFSLMAGFDPVIELTKAQQFAIMNTLPPEHLETDEWPFPHGAFVMLAEPFEFQVVPGDLRKLKLLGIHYPPINSTAKVLDGRIYADALCALENEYIILPQFDIGYDFTSDAVAELVDEGEDYFEEVFAIRNIGGVCELMQSVLAVIMTFGLTEERPPALRLDRAARRRLERAEAKRKHGLTVSIRYLKDHKGEVAVRIKHEKTGRKVRPHMRKGHIRWVPYGPRDVEERPTRRVYVGPVLVNGQLSDLDRMVIYRTKKEAS